MQFSTSNFAAEFGRVAGGLVNLTSRSGSNLSTAAVTIISPTRPWAPVGPLTNLETGTCAAR